MCPGKQTFFDYFHFQKAQDESSLQILFFMFRPFLFHD
jgi:hypothetical protein